MKGGKGEVDDEEDKRLSKEDLERKIVERGARMKILKDEETKVVKYCSR